MKNKFSIVILASILLLATTVCLCLNNPISYATSTKSLEYSDNFNSGSFDSVWAVNGATNGKDYNALSLINWDLWQPSVNLTTMPVEAGNDHATLTFDVNYIGGQWFGLCLGLPTFQSRFHLANCAIIMYGPEYNKTWLEIQSVGKELSGTATDKAGVKSYGKSVFNAKNTITTIQVDCYPNGKIEVFSANKGETLTQIAVWSPDITIGDNDNRVLDTKNGGILQENGFKDGYIGFAGMGSTSADILNFKYEKDGVLMYRDDFTTSKLAQEWRVSYNYTGTDHTRIGPSGYLELGAGNTVCYGNPIRINDLSDELFEMNFKLKFKQMSAGSLFEIALGMDNVSSNIAEADAIGIERTYSEYIFYYRKDGEKHYNYNDTWELNSFKNNEYYNFQLAGKHDDKLSVSFNGITVNTTIPFQGYFAFAGISASELTLCVDDFSIYGYNYYLSQAKNTAINFEGTKSEYDPETDYTYHSYYVCNGDYYVGKNVSHLLYKEDKDGYRLTKNDKLSFSSNINDVSSSAVFTARQKYTDCIVRFDIQMNETSANNPTNARIGIGFGLPSVYLYPVNYKYVFFQKCANDTKIGGRGGMMPVADGCTENIEDASANGYLTCSYDLWDSTSKTYNVMVVMENGNVKLYYKRSNQPDSMMSICRAEFEGASAYGYVSVFSYDGASFYLNNFSVTNIDSRKANDGTFDGYGFEGQLAQNTCVLSAGQKIRSQQTFGASYTVAKLVAEQGATVTVGFGDQQITITDIDLSQDSYVLFKVFNGKYSVGIWNGGSESQLYQPIIQGELTDANYEGKISLSADKTMTVKSIYTETLESSIEIFAQDYDEQYEQQFIKNVVRPSISKAKTEKDTNTLSVWVLIAIIGGSVVVAGAVAVAVCLIIKKRKGAINQ